MAFSFATILSFRGGRNGDARQSSSLLRADTIDQLLASISLEQKGSESAAGGRSETAATQELAEQHYPYCGTSPPLSTKNYKLLLR